MLLTLPDTLCHRFFIILFLDRPFDPEECKDDALADFRSLFGPELVSP
jgi:hypothetical protein